MAPRAISAILWTLISVNLLTLVVGGLVTWLGYAIPARLKQFGLPPEVAIGAGFASLLVACLGLCALNYASHHALNIYGFLCALGLSLMIFGLPARSAAAEHQSSATLMTSNGSAPVQQAHNASSILVASAQLQHGLGIEIVYYALMLILLVVLGSSLLFARHLRRKESERIDDPELEFGLSGSAKLTCESPIVCTCGAHLNRALAAQQLPQLARQQPGAVSLADLAAEVLGGRHFQSDELTSELLDRHRGGRPPQHLPPAAYCPQLHANSVHPSASSERQYQTLSAAPLLSRHPPPLAHKGFYRRGDSRLRVPESADGRSVRAESAPKQRDDDTEEEDDDDAVQLRRRRHSNPVPEPESAVAADGPVESHEASAPRGEGNHQRLNNGSRFRRNQTTQAAPVAGAIQQNLALLRQLTLNQTHLQPRAARTSSRPTQNGAEMIASKSTHQLCRPHELGGARCGCSDLIASSEQQQTSLDHLGSTNAASAASLTARLDASPVDWLARQPFAMTSSALNQTINRASGKTRCRIPFHPLMPVDPPSALCTMPRLGSAHGNRYNGGYLARRTNLASKKSKSGSSSVMAMTAGVAAALFGGMADTSAMVEPGEGIGLDDGGLLCGSGSFEINPNEFNDVRYEFDQTNDQELDASMLDMMSAVQLGAGHSIVQPNSNHQPVLDLAPLMDPQRSIVEIPR